MLNPTNIRPELMPARHCLLACIRCVLAFHEYDISESELFMYANGTDMEYVEEHSYLGACYTHIIASLQQMNLFPLSYAPTETVTDVVKQRILTHIASGNPVILCVHRDALGYSTEIEKHENQNHFVVVYDYDESDSTFHIVDPFTLDDGGHTNSYMGPIKSDVLIDAGWGYVFVHKPISKKPPLTFFYVHLLHCLSSFVGVDCEGTYGLTKQYLDQLLDMEALTNDDFQRICFNMYYNLKISSVFLILHYTAEALVIIYGNERFQSSVMAIKNEMQSWKMLCYGLMKIGLRIKKEKAATQHTFATRQFASVLRLLTEVTEQIAAVPPLTV